MIFNNLSLSLSENWVEVVEVLDFNGKSLLTPEQQLLWKLCKFVSDKNI